MTWTELLHDGVDSAYKVSDNLMALVKDDELAWKPATGRNWMTAGQLLRHMTEACGLCCKGFVTGDWGMPDGMDVADLPPEEMMLAAEKLPSVASVAEARRLLAADREVALAMIAQAGEEQLEHRLTSAPWEPDAVKPLGQHLLGMVLHLNQHKGQLFYYLKLMGRDVNTTHLWVG